MNRQVCHPELVEGHYSLMIVFPNCKINLGLFITGKRDDGYHDLSTVFYPAPWKDALEVVRSASDKTRMFVTGMHGDAGSNICMKAFDLLHEKFNLPPVNIHLLKNIPTGAGLGGGSADGAFTLKLLNENFQLGLSESELIDYSLQLGSDCPFFILNKPAIASGRGEKLKEIHLDLAGYHILIVHPGIHVSTADAFSDIHIRKDTADIEEIIAGPIQQWKDNLVNDFESSVFQKHPAIKQLKELMYDQGATYASMSGSGSSVYGIFANKPSLNSFPDPYKWKLFCC